MTPESFVPFQYANPYAKQMNEWRKVLEVQSLDTNLSPLLEGQKYTTDAGAKLRDLVHGGKWTESDNRMMNQQGWNTAGFRGLGEEGYYDKMSADNDFFRDDQPENKWLINDMFLDQVGILQSMQRDAAEEAGFDDRYGYDDYLEYNPDYKYSGKHMGQPIWASLYLDTSKSLPVASTFDDLHNQIETIDGYSDRSDAQRDYLHQKAIVRYWLGQIGSRGGTEALVRKMYDAEDPYMRSFADPDRAKMMLNGSSFDFDRIMNTKHGGWDAKDDPSANDKMYGQDKKMQGINGWVMPWMNAGEGILPEQMLDNTMNEWYRDEIERVNKDAIANTTEWIKTHGGHVNPNELLEGRETGIELIDMTQTGGENLVTLIYDEKTHTSVYPGDQSPGAVYNPDRHIPNASRHRTKG